MVYQKYPGRVVEQPHAEVGDMTEMEQEIAMIDQAVNGGNANRSNVKGR